MKKVIAISVSLLVAFLIVTGGTLAAAKFYGNLDLFEPTIDGAKEVIRSLSTIGLILVVVSHAIGSLVAGLVVGLFLKTDTINVGLTLGAIMTILGLINMIMIPTYPEWFYVDFIVYIPLSMFGANFTANLKSN